MYFLLSFLAGSFLLNSSCRAESSTATRFLRSSLAAECTSNDDCLAGSQYCSGGLCQEFGFCRDLADCLNPSNTYPSILCVGYVDCVNNQCGIQCSSDFCPDSQPTADCLASPCSVSLCPSSTTCVDYYCGGCNALCFDLKGDLPGGFLDNDSTPEPTSLENNSDSPVINGSTCGSDAECNDGEYCADGTCLELGSCSEDMDCVNPSNIFPVIECTGFIQCNEDKHCQRICGPFCPDDAPLVDCPSPCEDTPCDEDYVSCVPDNCGECKAIFFDAQGTQVCTTTEEIDSQSAACLKKNECPTTGNWFSRTMCSVKNALTKARCAF